MRWVLALAFCIAAGATTLVGLQEPRQPQLRVVIGVATPFPDDEDDQNPITSRYWYVNPPFMAEAEEPCDRAEAASGYQRFFNGEPVAQAEGDDYDHVEPSGRARRFRGEVDGPLGLPGETIRVTLRVKCVRPGQVVTGLATRRIEVPAASCSGGPLRVLEVRGRATSEDYEEGRSQSLSAGDLVWPGSDLDVAPGGELELGAAECNSLRLTFFGGRSRLGGYFPDRRTYSTGQRLLAEGDAHGGGWEAPERARVLPLAERCLGCVVNATRYEVRSSARRVTLRVFSGAALLYGGARRPVRVEDGETASVLCLASGCAPTRPRFFHEGEPWSTPANLPEQPFRRVVSGRSPPLWKLAPQFSRVSAERLGAAGGAPDQIAVSWSRQVRRKADYGYKEEYPEGGFFVWQRVAPSLWRVVYEKRFDYGGYDDVQIGDVTGDGHRDVLVAVVMGSGACGPRRLVAYAAKRTGDLYARDFCEGDAEIVGDALRVRRSIGPCPYREASAHCGGGFSTTFYRWRGAKLISARRTVRCNLARLDPARDCRPKHKRNTPKHKRNTP